MTLYESLQIVKFIDIWIILSVQHMADEIDFFELKKLYDEIKTRSLQSSNFVILEEEFYDYEKAIQNSLHCKSIRFMAYHLNRRELVDVDELPEYILIFSRIYHRTLKEFGIIDFCGRMLLHLHQRQDGLIEREETVEKKHTTGEMEHFCSHKNEMIRLLLARRLKRDFPLL